MVGKDRFENDDVYLSLYSMGGCTVYLTVSFPELKIINYSRKTVKENIADEAEFDSYLVCRNWKKEIASKGLEREGFIKDHVATVGGYPAA